MGTKSDVNDNSNGYYHWKHQNPLAGGHNDLYNKVNITRRNLLDYSLHAHCIEFHCSLRSDQAVWIRESGKLSVYPFGYAILY